MAVIDSALYLLSTRPDIASGTDAPLYKRLRTEI